MVLWIFCHCSVQISIQSLAPSPTIIKTPKWVNTDLLKQCKGVLTKHLTMTLYVGLSFKLLFCLSLPLLKSPFVGLSQGNVGPPGQKGDQGPEVSLCIYLMSAMPLTAGQMEISKHLLNINKCHKYCMWASTAESAKQRTRVLKFRPLIELNNIKASE